MAFDHGRFLRCRLHPAAGADRRFRHVLRGLACLLLLSIAIDPARADSIVHGITIRTPTNSTNVSHATAEHDASDARLKGVSTALPPPPANLSDLDGWLDYQTRNHITSLPEEARLFYRRGLLLHQSGGEAEAVRQVRGASILDPAYVEPHLTLASWFLLRDPSQTLLQYAAVLELARQNFIFQLVLVANALYLGLQALFLGLLATAFLLVWIHHRELRHGWKEGLGRFLSPATAGWWSWAFLFIPFFAGFGLALPTVVFLALLWPSLRASARAVFVSLVLMLAATPWITSSLDRLAIPLRDNRGPYWGVTLMEGEPYSQARRSTLAALADRYPNNAFLQFGLGWMTRRGGDLAHAEAAYRRTLVLWPHDDRVMNDLGNTLAMGGRTDEALDLYRRATDANPSNAAAWFNASQISTQRFDYRAANEALARASALNFDMVKVYQSRATNDGALPLVDQWLAPRTFWDRLSVSPSLIPGAPALPPSWRDRLECSGLPFSMLVLVLTSLALAFGIWQHRAIPLRTCSNCGEVVCRRCAQRRRELALCPDCVTVEARAESPEFARVLLLQHRRAVQGRQNLVRTAFATLIPGFGMLVFRRTLLPLLLLMCTAALIGLSFGTTAPFSYEPRLTLATGEIPMPVQIGLWVLLYSISLLGYFARVARADAQATASEIVTRGRSTPMPRRGHVAAA